MAKKQPSRRRPADDVIRVRVNGEEKRRFQEAAERDGFGANLSAWILWNLRRAEKGPQPPA